MLDQLQNNAKADALSLFTSLSIGQREQLLALVPMSANARNAIRPHLGNRPGWCVNPGCHDRLWSTTLQRMLGIGELRTRGNMHPHHIYGHAGSQTTKFVKHSFVCPKECGAHPLAECHNNQCPKNAANMQPQQPRAARQRLRQAVEIGIGSINENHSNHDVMELAPDQLQEEVVSDELQWPNEANEPPELPQMRPAQPVQHRMAVAQQSPFSWEMAFGAVLEKVAATQEQLAGTQQLIVRLLQAQQPRYMAPRSRAPQNDQLARQAMHHLVNQRDNNQLRPPAHIQRRLDDIRNVEEAGPPAARRHRPAGAEPEQAENRAGRRRVRQRPNVEPIYAGDAAGGSSSSLESLSL